MNNEKYINRTISVLYRYGQRYFTQMLKERQIPMEVGQLPFMMQVYRHPGISQDGISANAVMDKGTTAKCIKQLEISGLVVREMDEGDKRVNHVYPTEKALAIKGEVLKVIDELHAVLYKGFEPEEIGMANDFLERMKGNISDWLA